MNIIFPYFSSDGRQLCDHDMFTKDEIIEMYGELNPQIDKRTEYWNARWDEWVNNEVKVSMTFDGTNRHLRRSKIRRTDYMMRYGINCMLVRFKNREDMLWFELTKPSNEEKNDL